MLPVDGGSRILDTSSIIARSFDGVNRAQVRLHDVGAAFAAKGGDGNFCERAREA